jgi:AcrR family transcriptional regulator
MIGSVMPSPRAKVAAAPAPVAAGRVSLPDALALARRRFLAGRPIDLQELAAELGINRVTLYRWVGTHEQLMGQLLCGFADIAWNDARSEIRQTEPEHAARVIHRFLLLIQAFEPFQKFVTDDPEYALKLLTSKHSPLQERVIGHIRVLLDEQVRARQLKLPVDLDSLAYALVRICEAFLYNDLITGRRPDLGKAREIIAALLQAPWGSLRL